MGWPNRCTCHRLVRFNNLSKVVFIRRARVRFSDIMAANFEQSHRLRAMNSVRKEYDWTGFISEQGKMED